jgi:hypothetical protein
MHAVMFPSMSSYTSRRGFEKKSRLVCSSNMSYVNNRQVVSDEEGGPVSMVPSSTPRFVGVKPDESLASIWVYA